MAEGALTLPAGTRLGPYEIVSLLGVGGMGEVYRAHDTRLERTVAIKVLPADRCASPEARQRFEREARTISQLSHPHICALFDVGRHDTPRGAIDYLVMEYLEGEMLSQRLSKGALPLDQTLRFGVEIASALQRAHAQGIVHRDLKPANVMITRSGVKLLDFGLARTEAAAAPATSHTALPTRDDLTQEGTILGTMQYMAPEQLEGKEADVRSDIFALGTVIYEMATGRRAFSGSSQASLISSIMKDEPPPISRVSPTIPPALDHVVRSCLRKEPDERWQSAADVRNELRWIAEGGGRAVEAAPAAAAPGRRGLSEVVAWAAAVAAILLAAGLYLRGGRQVTAPQAPMRFSIDLPGKSSLRSAVLSPDGQRIAIVARDSSGKNLLWIRALDSFDVQPLPGTENPSFPFWSPDGRHIAFFADGKLKRMDAAGGPAQTICDAPINRGGSWGKDGTIVFTPLADGGVFRVPSGGGVPVPITRFDPARGETTHRWPYFLPDGRNFLYLVASFAAAGEQEKMGVYVHSLDTGEERFLARATSSMAYAAPGYLLLLRERNLLAQAFDAQAFALSGETFPVATQIQFFPQIYNAIFSVSDTGTLLYQNQSASAVGQLVWFDRTGNALGSLGAPADQSSPNISPDGKRVALAITDPRSGNSDVWTYESTGGIATRLTTRSGLDGAPVWSPDGSRLAFLSLRRTHTDLFMMDSGGGGEKPLLENARAKFPMDWSPDGSTLLFRTDDPNSNLQLWKISADGRGEPEPFIKAPYGVSSGRFSPDGRFVAYASNETGRWEIYVAPYPGPGGNWRVSTEGGSEPRWRRDGKELFYLGADGRLMAVAVRLGQTFDADAPKPLFTIRRREPIATFDYVSYDVTADGQRFLVNTDAGDATAPPLNVVLHWAASAPK